MLNITGLGDEIFEVMLRNAQQKIQEQILTAASQGQTNCTVRSKGLTPSFLSALENEGVSNIQREDGLVKLFWEF
ncbi:hypothetical protein GVK83_10145 [Enterococcus hirae]|uniref:hypothetical protein n=1 Tax=Enterococcus hirae TaxID=1354 RepID=UPI001372E448|nr:hypothetical protein [Enterococcus hirae]NBA21267.1 hypothetical protein [Enterococcus hirae]NBA28002.1 hypothetical protein [Enterococcus hirae]NBA34349.1 hypothetical protein [Enterococcus hirae]NBA37151.1 hypothetical protein [Enterococcus hirae]NBA42478.1 hypothetical protein [Enterococcus hirae]